MSFFIARGAIEGGIVYLTGGDLCAPDISRKSEFPQYYHWERAHTECEIV